MKVVVMFYRDWDIGRLPDDRPIDRGVIQTLVRVLELNWGPPLSVGDFQRLEFLVQVDVGLVGHVQES